MTVLARRCLTARCFEAADGKECRRQGLQQDPLSLLGDDREPISFGM